MTKSRKGGFSLSLSSMTLSGRGKMAQIQRQTWGFGVPTLVLSSSSFKGPQEESQRPAHSLLKEGHRVMEKHCEPTSINLRLSLQYFQNN